MKKTISEKCSNPMNIKYVPSQKWVGEEGNYKGFVVFRNDALGYRAAIKILLGYIGKGFDTPDKIIRRWAPESENDVKSYVSTVCKYSKMGRDMVIDSVPKLLRLIKWMTFVERGLAGDITLIKGAFNTIDVKGLGLAQAEGFFKITKK